MGVKSDHIPGSGQNGQPNIDNAEEGKPKNAGQKLPTDVPDEALLHGWALYSMASSVIFAVLLVALTATILGTATPSITDEFHTVQDVGWYASAYLIANCALTPFTGTIYRLFHLKIVFLFFISVFEIGSLVCATAPSSTALIIGRAICGLGASGVITGTTTIVATTVPLSKRAFLIGMGAACIAIGQTVGPLIGGLFASYVTWRWCFYINLPLGGAVAIFFGFFIKLPITHLTDSKLKFHQKFLTIDLVGFCGLAVSCVMLLLGLEYGGSIDPWNSATVIGLLCGGAVGIVLLVGWFVYKGDDALIPPRLLRDRINASIGITAFLQGGGIFLSSYWLPIWFQGVKEASPIGSGVMILPTIISQFIAAVVCGGLVQRLGYYLPEVIFGNALIAAGAAMMILMTPSSSEGFWIGFQILMGAGRGFVLQLLVTAIQTNLPREDASLGASFVSFSQYLSGAIFAAVAKAVFTSSLPHTLHEYAPGVSPALVIDTGVTEFKDVVPPPDLPGVLLAYNKSINHVFTIQLACSAAALVSGFFVGWRKVNAKKKKKAPKDAESSVAEDLTESEGDKPASPQNKEQSA